MTKTHLLLLVGILIMVLAAGLALAACGGGGSGPDVALAYTYAVGDTWVHEMSTTVSGSTQGLGAEGAAETTETTKTRITSEVEAVADDGTATISVTTEVVEMSIDGVAQDVTAELPQTVTITMDRAGNILATEGGGDAASGFLESGNFLDPNDLGTQLGSMIYPKDGTAKVGEEWTSTAVIPLTGLGEDLTLTTKAQLAGLATENGRQVAAIEYETKMPLDMELDLGPLFSAMFGASEDDSNQLVFKMGMKGTIEFTGVTKVDVATGQAASTAADGTMNVSIEVTEAPEMIVPKDQRGPFATEMALTMTVEQIR